MSTYTSYDELIKSIANQFGVDFGLVLAVVLHESSGNPWAWNPEPAYRYFWNVKTNAPFRGVTQGELIVKYPPKDFPDYAGDTDQEWWAQQASWGLMQVMGAVAREQGYSDPYLPSLCNPQAGVTHGVIHLKKQLARAAGNESAALSAYNTGSLTSPLGAAYASVVLQIKAGLK